MSPSTPNQGKMIHFVYSMEVERALKSYVWANRREVVRLKSSIERGEDLDQADPNYNVLEKYAVTIHKLPTIYTDFVLMEKSKTDLKEKLQKYTKEKKVVKKTYIKKSWKEREMEREVRKMKKEVDDFSYDSLHVILNEHMPPKKSKTVPNHLEKNLREPSRCSSPRRHVPNSHMGSLSLLSDTSNTTTFSRASSKDTLFSRGSSKEIFNNSVNGIEPPAIKGRHKEALLARASSQEVVSSSGNTKEVVFSRGNTKEGLSIKGSSQEFLSRGSRREGLMSRGSSKERLWTSSESSSRGLISRGSSRSILLPCARDSRRLVASARSSEGAFGTKANNTGVIVCVNGSAISSGKGMILASRNKPRSAWEHKRNAWEIKTDTNTLPTIFNLTDRTSPIKSARGS